MEIWKSDPQMVPQYLTNLKSNPLALAEIFRVFLKVKELNYAEGFEAF